MNLAYLIFSLIAAYYLSRSSTPGHRMITVVCAFWILGGSIIHDSSMTLPGDMQIKRLLFFLMGGYLLYTLAMQIRAPGQNLRLPYEKYIYVYYAAFFVVLIYHVISTHMLTFKESLGPIQGMLTVLIFYLILRYHATLQDLAVLIRAWILTGVVSSGVALVQFFVSSDFLRVGYLRGAYVGQIRAFGIFNAEYLNSYFLIVAIVLTLLFVRPMRWKILMTGLFFTAIALSFHRMSWAVALFVVGLYIALVIGGRIWTYIIVGSAAAFVGYVVLTEFLPLVYQSSQSSMLRGRLSADTMNERFRFYTMVLERFDKVYAWGAGSIKSTLYYYGMISAGAGEEWAHEGRGGIHNLYLETLFFYGLPVLLTFVAMLAATLRYFNRLFRSVGKEFLVPFLFLVMFVLMNMTNGFPLYGDFGVLFAIALGGGGAAARSFAGYTRSERGAAA